MPRGNPAPGPRFDYKLRWFDRLMLDSGEQLASDVPVVLAGDCNVIPTDLDVYAPARWVDDALFRPEVREAYRQRLAADEPDDEREDDRNDDAGHDRKVENAALGFDADISRQASETESRQPWPQQSSQKQCSTDGDQKPLHGRHHTAGKAAEEGARTPAASGTFLRALVNRMRIIQ